MYSVPYFYRSVQAGVLLCACLLGVAAGVPRLPRPAGPPRPQPRLFPAPRHRRLGIFPDNPLISVKRSFQVSDIVTPETGSEFVSGLFPLHVCILYQPSAQLGDDVFQSVTDDEASNYIVFCGFNCYKAFLVAKRYYQFDMHLQVSSFPDCSVALLSEVETVGAEWIAS